MSFLVRLSCDLQKLQLFVQAHREEQPRLHSCLSSFDLAQFTQLSKAGKVKGVDAIAYYALVFVAFFPNQLPPILLTDSSLSNSTL